MGTKLDVESVVIDDPTASTVRCHQQGRAKGGAYFRRLEGAWPAEGAIYFLSTDGGIANEGTVFRFDIDNLTLEVIFDSAGVSELDNPDNIVVTPRGAFILCEDNSGSPSFIAPQWLQQRAPGRADEGRGDVHLRHEPRELLCFRAWHVHASGKPHRLQPERARQSMGGCDLQPRWRVALRLHTDAGQITFAITGPWSDGPF